MLIDAGSSILWSGPTIILVMCGTTSPTHPMIPLILTLADVISVHAVMNIILSLFGFNPSDCASSSPILRRFRCHLISRSIISPIIIGIMIIANWFSVTFSRLPISQYTISGSLSYGSARNFIPDISALNSADTATPARTSTNVPVDL